MNLKFSVGLGGRNINRTLLSSEAYRNNDSDMFR